MKSYLVYQKLCIICSRNFESSRVNALYCSKKCQNRTRYLPQRLINSLIEKYSLFTSVKRYGDGIQSPQTVLQEQKFSEQELNMAKAEARAIAASRGIIPDQSKYIFENDPANQGPEGFGVRSDNNGVRSTTVLRDNKTTNTSITSTIDVNPVISTGLRKLGGGK